MAGDANATKNEYMKDALEGGEFGIGLATMNPDGSARHHISPNPRVDELHHPAWESVP
jgi:hypothetical protein